MRYSHDLKVRVASVGALIPLVALAILGITVGSSDQPTPSISAFAYFHEGGYHFILYVGDDGGRPLPDAAWSLQLVNSSPPTGQRISSYTFSATSDGNGVATVVANVPPANYSVHTAVGNSEGSLTESWIVGPGEGWGIVPGDNVLQPGRSGFLTTEGGVLAFFAGPNGSEPRGYSVAYDYENGTSNLGPPTTTPWVPLGGMRGYSAFFPLTFPGSVVSSLNTTIGIAILAPNGKVVASAGFSPVLFSGTGGPDGQAVRAVGFTTGVLSFVTALVAVFLSYASYAGPRSTRVLEVALSRPVTAGALLLVRFGTVVLSTTLAGLACLICLNLTLQSAWGVGLGWEFVALAAGATAVMSSALAGLVFMVARVTKDLPTTIGAIVSIFAALTIVWTPLTSTFPLASPAQSGVGTSAVIELCLNPVNSQSIALGAWKGFAVQGSTVVDIPPAALAWPIALLVFAVWAAIPIGISLLLALFRE
jgi:hypothetical protein